LSRERDGTRATVEPPHDPPSADVESCYRASFAFVWRVVRALGVDVADCDDVVQEVFLIVRKRWSSFDRERSMRAWVAGIARRVAGHHMRRRARARRREAAWAQPEPERSPQELLERADASSAVADFLASLDADKREVFVLMDIEGLSGRETAEIVGAGAPTVYSRLREARRRFASFVADRNAGAGGPP
jgi:RNA polymerase sigma-70 factor (ECF subfamily)